MRNRSTFILLCCLAVPTSSLADSLDQNGVFDKKNLLIELNRLPIGSPNASSKTFIGVIKNFKLDFPFSTLTLKSGKLTQTIRVNLGGFSNADLPSISELMDKGNKVKVNAWASTGVLVASSIKKWPLAKSATSGQTYIARSPAKSRAVRSVPLRGEPLRALIGVLGSADVNFDDKARQRPGVYLARDFTARYIKDLKISKDLNNGLLNVRFYHPVRSQGQDPYARYMMRLFDVNGNYLTYFNTVKILEIPEGKDSMNWAGYVNFSFQINVRDLRDTKIVEFGYMPISLIGDKT